jgi:hypothetical protein
MTMENDLRSPQHQVTGSGAQRVERRQDLPWEFKERIRPAARIWIICRR